MDSLEQYFSQRLLTPLREWQKEAQVNKEFYLGEKQYEYIPTVAGHEPAVEFPDEN